MAQTLILNGRTRACLRKAEQRLEAPRSGAARLLARARSATRTILAALGTYFPWSRSNLRGWKSSLDFWSPLGEAPRMRTRRRRTSA